ncbi:MAG: hybrid sensor histidine kinase/response regulator [Bacteroidetes bacterium]|nr:hybrid sensor histidine kinase/response regulator [Bacteroidota bacterium]
MEQTISRKKTKLLSAVTPIKILLVDDIPENLLTLENIIEDESRLLIKAFSGNEALKIIMEESIDLVLLDIQMPEMDGVEVAQLLRNNSKTKHIPIIFVSAIARSERPPLDGFQLGTVDFIPKPLDIDETRKKVAMYELLCRERHATKHYIKQTEKLTEQLEKFIYITSHDLNAPVRAIDNLADWLKEDLGDKVNDEIAENLSLLKNRVKRLDILLNGLLDYSRTTKLNEDEQLIFAGDAIKESFDAIEGSKEFNISLNNVEAEFVGNRKKITRVFFEIFKNSIIHHPEKRGNIKVDCVTSGSFIEFIITDDGSGIKPQHANVVFDLFHTLQPKDVVSTAGVGLTIAKKLIEETGGKIWINPTLKKGTAVHFTLPL